MTHISVDLDERPFWSRQSAYQVARAMRPLRTALIVGLAYYLGARIGFALTLKPSPVSTLWPPNSILLAAFLLTPVSSWWAILSGAFLAHVTVQLQSGIPPVMVVAWFVSNCAEGLIGAGIIRRYIKGPLHFETFREAGIFVVGAVLVGTALSSFLDAGFVSLLGLGQSGYWDVWVSRTASNVLASLTLVPVIVTWANGGKAALRTASLRRYIEAAVLGGGLLAVCVLVFGSRGTATNPEWLYAPLPFLAWAAIRFGPRGTSSCLLLVTLLAIWGAVTGHGPFVAREPAENALSIQLFLSVFSIPLLTLAAVTREREHAIDTARESQDRLDLTLCASQTGTWEWWIAADRWSMSSQVRQILGLTDSAEVLTLNDFLGVVIPEDRGMLSERLRRSVEQGFGFEVEFRPASPDGSVRWVLSRGEVIGGSDGAPLRLVAAIVDITERKLVEKIRQEEFTLRASEARLRELANAMPQIVWTASADGRMDYFNRRWYQITGASEYTLLEQSWLSMTHPDDRQKTQDAWLRAVAAGAPCEVEHRLLIAETGDYRWHLARALPIRDAAGNILRWYGSCTDIEDYKVVEQKLRDIHHQLEQRVEERTSDLSAAVTALRVEVSERVAAERALRSSEQRFSTAFHSSPDAIVIVHQKDYRFVEVNEKWEAMFGYSRAEVIGRTADELGLTVYEEQRQRGSAQLEAEGHLPELELEARTRSGNTLHVLLRADSLEMAGEPCHIISLRDVTARKRADSAAEEQRRELAHLGRVATLSQLSGALAHELNQPLAAILANVRAAQRMVRKDSPDFKELRAILEDIALDDRRAGDVIGRLRSLLKKGDAQASEVRLNDLVTGVTRLLHSDLIRRRVATETDLAPSLPLVLGEPVELQQVMLNLVANACDGMAGIPADQRRVTISTGVTSEGLVQLSVRDQGEGIPPDRLEQIFDAFFTTKNHGLGLGLAICRSIVTAHGGRLWAVNNPLGGATFHMLLNRADHQNGADQPGEDVHSHSDR
jgi:PAS domain S-box-containing protein